MFSTVKYWSLSIIVWSTILRVVVGWFLPRWTYALVAVLYHRFLNPEIVQHDYEILCCTCSGLRNLLYGPATANAWVHGGWPHSTTTRFVVEIIKMADVQSFFEQNEIRNSMCPMLYFIVNINLHKQCLLSNSFFDKKMDGKCFNEQFHQLYDSGNSLGVVFIHRNYVEFYA